MTKSKKFLFHLLMSLTVAAMIYGHVLIIVSGKYFDKIRGEKYDVLHRWVSDFVAVYPEGLLLKVSIILFCIAIIIRAKSRLECLGEGSRETLAWFWEITLCIGLVSGLLLVVLFDTPAPRYEYQITELNLWQKLFGGSGKWVKQPKDWVMEGHHRVGFRVFICSFIAMVITSVIRDGIRKDLRQFRVNLVIFLLLLGSTVWLILFTNSLAGIPQRALLLLVFYWIWRAAFVETSEKPIKMSRIDQTKVSA